MLNFIAKAHALTIVNPLKAGSIPDLINTIAQFAMEIGLPIAIMFIVYAGFLFVSARGDVKKLEKAKGAFTWAVVGAALIVGARFLAIAISNFAKGL